MYLSSIEIVRVLPTKLQSKAELTKTSHQVHSPLILKDDLCCVKHQICHKMGNEIDASIIVEATDDGLFMAYYSGRAGSYALGETEEEARSNFLERYEFEPESWADSDEYTILHAALC